MINNSCGFLDSVFDTLLNAYQMKDWGMSWFEFLRQAQEEMYEAMEGWADTALYEEGKEE